MLDNNFKLPELGDQLFIEGKDWFNNACLNYLKDNWDLYIMGYKLAGDKLVEYIVKKNVDQDFLVFPIVFLYRHHIELQLKIIIREGNKLLGIEEDFESIHKLDKLWTKASSIIKKVWPKIGSNIFIAVSNYIFQFNNIDPKSFSFRYPEDKERNKNLNGLEKLNIRNFSEVINKLANFLEGCSYGISVYLETKREMESEYRE